LFFVVWFVVLRRRRLAVGSVVGFAAASAVGFVVFPGMSERFWTSTFWKLQDSVAFVPWFFARAGNASVAGVVAYLGGPHWLGTVLSGVVGLAGLWFARQAYLRCGSSGWGLMVSVVSAGVTATVITPVSWVHRAVFFVPAVLILFWNGSALQRKAAIVLGATLFCHCAPISNVLAATHNPWLAPLALLLCLVKPVCELCAVVLLAMPVGSGGRASLPQMARYTGEQLSQAQTSGEGRDRVGRAGGGAADRRGGGADPAPA
jgi:hypothetical protein